MKEFWLKSLIAITPCILSQCNPSERDKIQSGQPNILIAIGDDISWQHMGAYGCTWIKTPGFDRVAKDGIIFRNAYTPNAKSSPSRACLLTGRNSWQLEEAANHVPFFPLKFTTFVEALRNNGYTAGFTGKGWAPGVAIDSSGNPRDLTGKAFNTKKIKPPAEGISNSDYAGNFEEFLNSKDPSGPFCFWYGSHEPHRKYQFGSGVSIGEKSPDEIEKVPDFWPDNETVRYDMLDYAFEIEHFDSHLLKMLDLLERRGELDNTIIIVTADNGMPFPRVKGQCYEYSNHMPLAVMWGKGIKNPGRVIYDYVSFIDLAPTLLDACGITPEESGMQPAEGKSLLKILETRRGGLVEKSRDFVLLGKERHDVGRPDDAGYPIRGIVNKGYLYIINYKLNRWPSGDPETGYLDCDGSPVKSLILNMNRMSQSSFYWKLSFGKRYEEELYNVSSDPECMINLATDPGFNPLKQKMREQLIQNLSKQEDPRVLGNGDIFDKYTYSSETVRDFYNRYMKGEISRRSAGWVDSTDFEE